MGLMTTINAARIGQVCQFFVIVAITRNYKVSVIDRSFMEFFGLTINIIFIYFHVDRITSL